MRTTLLVNGDRKGRLARLGLAVALLAVVVALLLALTPRSPRSAVAPLVDQSPVVASVAPVPQAAEPGASTAAALRRITQVKASVPEPTLNEITSGLMVDLGLRTPDPDALQAQSVAALSGIRAMTGQPAQGEGQPVTLQGIVAKALREGQSDAYIDALVNEAVGRGDITAPREIVTENGRVDTHVLLAGLVAQATRDAGLVAPKVAPSGEGVEVRVVQKADGATERHHFYTVNPGDSLGAIAHRFYGDANRFMAIYEANRMIVSSPDKIRVGQRLVIPSV